MSVQSKYFPQALQRHLFATTNTTFRSPQVAQVSMGRQGLGAGSLEGSATHLGRAKGLRKKRPRPL